MEGFYSKGLSTKANTGLFSDQDIFQGEGLGGKNFYQADCHCFLWGMERGHMIDYLIGADEKNPDWLVG